MKRVTAALQRWWLQAAHLVAAGIQRLRRNVTHAVRRVRQRWSADVMFRRTIATAITALSTTAIPSPTISAAVSAYLAEHPRRPTRSVLERDDDRDEDDLEDDDFEDWRPSPRPLWDRLR